MFEPNVPEPASDHMSRDSATDAAERYERGLALRKASLFKQAIEQFEKATGDQAYALKAYAQIGLCCKSSRQFDQAVTAFRNALKVPAAAAKETVQILYVLGRTLESLSRIAEALEVYRWLRREDPQYRDVAERIESLSTRRVQSGNPPTQRGNLWARQVSQAWQGLLRTAKE